MLSFSEAARQYFKNPTACGRQATKLICLILMLLMNKACSAYNVTYYRDFHYSLEIISWF